MTIKINENMYLNSFTVNKKVQSVPTITPTDHIMVIDISGSMSYILPEIRNQLKTKLITLVNEQDTVTIIWYSGKNQFGTLIEAFPIKTAQDLTTLHTAIDRFLRPMGLTGFVQPLQEVAAVIKRSCKNNVSLMFMSDGYDNQWTESQIISAIKELEKVVNTSTIIEYGYYANRNLLSKMAETVGGSHIFADDFSSYQPVFESHIKKNIGGKKISITLPEQPLYDIAYTYDNSGVNVYTVVNNKVFLPENTSNVYWIGSEDHGDIAETKSVYSAIYVLAQRLKSNAVLDLLKYTGDVRLIKKYTNAFGKQALGEFQTMVLECIVDDTKMFSDGKDYNLVFADDAYTLIDLLTDLAADNNRFYPNHNAFVYNKIGRTRKAKSVLTESNVDDLNEMLLKADSIDDLEKIDKLVEDMGESELKFIKTNTDIGYPINGIVFNENRANVSIRVQYDGIVDLTKLNNKVLVENLGEEIAFFPTKQYRNYAIIRDGIVNVSVFPTRLTFDTWEKLNSIGIVTDEYNENQIYLLDLSSIPVINRKMVNEVSAVELFNTKFELLKVQAAQKVYKNIKEELYGPKLSKSYIELYGVEATEVLKEIGLTEHNGFNPKSVLADSTDVYKAVSLDVKVAGLSSLPSIKKVQEKLLSKKPLTISEKLISDVLDVYNKFVSSKVFDKVTPEVKSKLIKEWVEKRTVESINESRKLIKKIAQVNFSIILGQIWPKEFATLEESSLELNVSGWDKPVKFTLSLEDIEEKI